MIDASTFIGAAVDHGYDWYSGVPCSYLTSLVNAAIVNDDIYHLPVANEGDAIAAAVGATLGGRSAIAYMQNSGLGNAVSPITSLVYTFRVPVLIIVSLLSTAAQLLNALGLVFQGVFSVFFFGLLWFVAFCGIQFVLIVFLRPRESEEPDA